MNFVKIYSTFNAIVYIYMTSSHNELFFSLFIYIYIYKRKKTLPYEKIIHQLFNYYHHDLLLTCSLTCISTYSPVLLRVKRHGLRG